MCDCFCRATHDRSHPGVCTEESAVEVFTYSSPWTGRVRVRVCAACAQALRAEGHLPDAGAED